MTRAEAARLRIARNTEMPPCFFDTRLVHVAWAGAEKSVQQLVGQWGHHLALTKIADVEEADFYLDLLHAELASSAPKRRAP